MADVANKYPENVEGKFYSMTRHRLLTSAGKLPPRITKRNGRRRSFPSFTNSRRLPKKKRSAKKPWKVCPVEAIGSDGA